MKTKCLVFFCALSLVSILAAQTGGARPIASKKGDAPAAELAKCQAALGPRGYLSAFPGEHFDRVESMRMNGPF
jgi:hypothetical protein